jgi:hypothetical protein
MLSEQPIDEESMATDFLLGKSSQDFPNSTYITLGKVFHAGFKNAKEF